VAAGKRHNSLAGKVLLRERRLHRNFELANLLRLNGIEYDDG